MTPSIDWLQAFRKGAEAYAAGLSYTDMHAYAMAYASGLRLAFTAGFLAAAG